MGNLFRKIAVVSVVLGLLTGIPGQNDVSKNKFAESDKPDGELVDGVRVISISTDSQPGNISIYRGEEVRLVIRKINFPYSVHIPEYGISKAGQIGKDLAVEFKAARTGVFPMFCNGKCPTGDGQRFAQIVVMEYRQEDASGSFRTVTYKEALDLLQKEKPLILDVRTPTEFYDGYIKGALLIPVQQLAFRADEIAAHKGRPVLVYCRSGNRSIPASQILLDKGFKKVYNLNDGIKEWVKGGGELAK